MLLTSTFPDLSEDEALRELNPTAHGSGSGSGSGNAPSNTPPPSPVHHGRLAGWVSGLPDTANDSASTTGSCSCRCPRANSSAAGPDFCPNGKEPPTAVPATSSFVRPISLPTPRSESAQGRITSTSGSGSDGAATAEMENHAAGARPRWESIGTVHSPFSTQREPGNCLCSGDGAAGGGERSAGSPRELSLSSAGEDGGPVMTASRRIRRGDVVAVERPRVAAQSSKTLPWVAACPGCLRHVGTLDAQLAIASGERDRAEVFSFGSGAAEPATAVAAAAAGSMSSTPPEPAVPGAAPCFQHTAESREGGGEGGGCGRSERGGEGARLPLLEGLSERFVQVG